MSSPYKLIDSSGRHIDYLRLAITDRCNLRCLYCMPPEGIPLLPREAFLSFEEMTRVVALSVSLGIRKVRLTGGEPLARRGIVDLIRQLRRIDGLEDVHITTNGLEAAATIPALKTAGISGINVSLDTLQRDRFKQITHRDGLESVLKTITTIQHHEIPLKINTNVLQGINTDELAAIAAMTKHTPIEVRFIEQMPFGGGTNPFVSKWNAGCILETLQKAYPDMQLLDLPHSTARVYSIPLHTGTIGIIGAYSRLFCHSCNRLRVTVEGSLRTCLYEESGLDLKVLLRSKANNEEIKRAIASHVAKRKANGILVEAQRTSGTYDSMALVGG